jgi:hypothetical protein
MSVMAWVVTCFALMTWREKLSMIVVAVLSFLEFLVTVVAPVTLEPFHAVLMVKC